MASQWYYASGGKQLGPVTDDQLRQLAATGQIQASDLVWTTGMANWAPAGTVAGLMAPAPAPLPIPQPLAYATPTLEYTQAQGKKLNAMPTLILYGGGLVVGSIGSLIALNGETIAANGIAGLGNIASLVGFILGMILHYHVWAALPAPYRATTPGRAVGFLFIPFFNIYWIFVSFVSLAKGYAACGEASPSQGIRNFTGLAITFCVLPLAAMLLWIALVAQTTASMVAAGRPNVEDLASLIRTITILGALVNFAMVAIFVMLCKGMTDNANRAMGYRD